MHRSNVDHPIWPGAEGGRWRANEEESDPVLKRRLKSLALDPDFEGSEEEKNRKLAPAEYVKKKMILRHLQSSRAWVRMINEG